jgi:hypothetical protein
MASRLLKKFDTTFDLKESEINVIGELIIYSDGSYDIWSHKVTNQLDIDPSITDEEIDDAILQLDFSEFAMIALQEYREHQRESRYIAEEKRWEEKEEERRWLNESN